MGKELVKYSPTWPGTLFHFCPLRIIAAQPNRFLYLCGREIVLQWLHA